MPDCLRQSRTRHRRQALASIALLLLVAGCSTCAGEGAECTSSTDCPAGQVCLEGACHRACNRGSDCPPGEACVQGACWPAADAGRRDAQVVDGANVDAATDAASLDALDGGAPDHAPDDLGTAIDGAVDASPDGGQDAGRPPPPDWWHPSWRYRHPVVVDTAWLDEELVDVPLPLRLPPGALARDEVQDQGADLRFVDAQGQRLPHEIERWDPEQGSLVWVGVPRVASGGPVHTLWLYHGNPLATDWQDAPGVWRDGFEAVWHLDASLRESSGRLAPGTRMGATEAAGVLGASMALAGAPQHALLASQPDLLRSVAQFSVEAWVRKASPAATGNMWIVSVSTHDNPPGTASRATVAFTSTDEVGVWGRAYDLAAFSSLTSTTSPITDASWHYLVGSVDLAGGQLALHLDGEPLRSGAVSFASPVTHHLPPKVVILGSQDDLSGDFLVGGVDELRLSRVLRSDAWIRFAYLAASGAISHLGASESIGHYPRGTAPLAVDDSAVVPEDSEVWIDVLANDQDLDGDSLRVVEVFAGSLGEVALVSGGRLHYRPGPDLHGQDVFGYAVSDGVNGIGLGTVRVTIAPMPDPPRPATDVVATLPGAAVDVDVLANDLEVDGQALRLVAVGAVASGSAAAVGGQVRYTPPSSGSLRAAFDYTVQDEDGLEATAQVVVVVHPSAPGLRFVEEGGGRGFDDPGAAFGQAWADVDEDGDSDVWLGGVGRLLRNQGDRFEPWLELPGDRGGFWADPDNDGDLDLLTTNTGGFYANDGQDLVEGAAAAGLVGSNLGSAVWFDLDRDGWMDAFFPNGSDPFVEFRHNLGAIPVQFETLNGASLGVPTSVGNAEGSTAADVDDDGDQDLWVNGATQGFLLLNQGNGTFVDHTVSGGLQHTYSDPYYGVAFGDCDNDGDLDLFVGHQAGRSSRLYLNSGSGVFTRSAQLYWDMGQTRGVAWGDLDQDGSLDLVVANEDAPDLVFLNDGQCRFVRVDELLGLDPQAAPTRSILPVDVDGDGDLDLAVARHEAANALWLNRQDSDRFLRVIVRGAGAGAAARDGIGTRVLLREASSGQIVGTREVNGGEGYASHDLTPLHFGLPAASGGAGGHYLLEVRFADGATESRILIPAEAQVTLGGVILRHTVEVAQ